MFSTINEHQQVNAQRNTEHKLKKRPQAAKQLEQNRKKPLNIVNDINN